VSTATIYALKDGSVFGYVGQTARHPQVRLYAHVITAKRGSRLRVHEWMREVMAEGREIGIEALESCAKADALRRERFHIKRLADLDQPLTNEAAPPSFDERKRRGQWRGLTLHKEKFEFDLLLQFLAFTLRAEGGTWHADFSDLWLPGYDVEKFCAIEVAIEQATMRRYCKERGLPRTTDD